MTKPSIEVVERHPHLAVPVADGYVRVDMHTHTMWSGDSTTTPDEFTASVAESGLEVVCITDHNDIAGAVELADRLECRVIVGEELRTPAGEIIGLFLTDRIPMGVGHIEAAMAIRDQGGVVYIPHPFDTMRRNLSEAALYELAEAELIDVVEVLNAKTSLASLNRRAAEFAAEFGIAAGAGSDAHVPAALGAAYVEMPDFSSAADFCSALRAGTVVGHHWDEPRPWSPRIVPSVNPS
ncbi:MAG: PHP domain-containing protein [Actinobacteria bacterium]|nr:PHP domain-containing protein [Actinomycetota bacterium]